MTTPTFTFELTAEQAEDLFDAVNIASLHYALKAEDAKRDLGAYDFRLSSADKLATYENRRDLFSQRWVEFYQHIKTVRGVMRAERVAQIQAGDVA